MPYKLFRFILNKLIIHFLKLYYRPGVDLCGPGVGAISATRVSASEAEDARHLRVVVVGGERSTESIGHFLADLTRRT